MCVLENHLCNTVYYHSSLNLQKLIIELEI
jgi:hypothetical protein